MNIKNLKKYSIQYKINKLESFCSSIKYKEGEINHLHKLGFINEGVVKSFLDLQRLKKHLTLLESKFPNHIYIMENIETYPYHIKDFLTPHMINTVSPASHFEGILPDSIKDFILNFKIKSDNEFYTYKIPNSKAEYMILIKVTILDSYYYLLGESFKLE